MNASNILKAIKHSCALQADGMDYQEAARETCIKFGLGSEFETELQHDADYYESEGAMTDRAVYLAATM